MLSSVMGLLLLAICSRVSYARRNPRGDISGIRDFNECLLSPCLNDGSCINLDGSYRCMCTRGFTGPNCEMDIDECLSAPCKFGGTCVDRVDSYYCRCPPGRRGRNCGRYVNEHLMTRCLNGGTSINVEGAYVCVCPPGWTGPRCQFIAIRNVAYITHA